MLSFIAAVAAEENMLELSAKDALVGEDLGFTSAGHYVYRSVVLFSEPTGYKYPGRKITRSGVNLSHQRRPFSIFQPSFG